jgi:hypothetical protein
VKSIDVSASTPGVVASVLQELRDEGGAAKSATDEAEDAASKSVPFVVPVGVSILEAIDSESGKSEERPVITDSELETGLEIPVTGGSMLTETEAATPLDIRESPESVPLATDSVSVEASALESEEVTVSADVEVRVKAASRTTADDGEESPKESESTSFPLPDSEKAEEPDSAPVQAGEVDVATAGQVEGPKAATVELCEDLSTPVTTAGGSTASAPRSVRSQRMSQGNFFKVTSCSARCTSKQ